MANILRGAAASTISCLIAAIALAPNATADLLSYDIGWTGANGYSMTGEFIFDDIAGADGLIDEAEVLTLHIEGLVGGVSFASWNLADGLSPGAMAFNFNFNTLTEAFQVGGLNDGLNGQLWNVGGVGGFGFYSGNSNQGLDYLGVNIEVSEIPVDESTLAATPRAVVAVPEPTTVALFGAGLIGLVLTARRRRSASEQTGSIQSRAESGFGFRPR